MSDFKDKPTSFGDLFPGRFVKACDLKNKDATLTIGAVDLEELEGETGKKTKGIISFVETKKQFVLNKTNGICIRELFGRDVQGWVGHKVTLTPEMFGGDPCIRIKGSPELEEDRVIEVKLPKKRPQRRTLCATGKKAGG